MGDSGLRPELQQFIIRKIDSVELLEVLINLQKNRPSPVSADSLAVALYSSAMSVRLRLEKLVELELAKSVGNEGYRYAPASPADDRMVESLAIAYQERPVAVIAAITSRPVKTIQAFSDAFLFRRGDDTQ